MRSEARSAPLDAVLLAEAVELSRRSPPSPAAYAVGALVVGADPGTARSVGWSRRHGPLDHAEEVALAAFPGDPAGGTLYSSLEPCSRRRSRRRTCTELILAAGIARVVFALREPPLFADCDGAELLARAGVEVVELAELAGGVRAVNAHLLG
jgi:pyrimidine deaminase RibD-like protein